MVLEAKKASYGEGKHLGDPASIKGQLK